MDRVSEATLQNKKISLSLSGEVVISDPELKAQVDSILSENEIPVDKGCCRT